MNKYRAFASFSYEFESEKDFAETLNEATQLIENIIGQPVKIRLEKIPVKTSNRIRLAEYTPEEILSDISRDDRKKEFKIGDKIYHVRMDSTRYFVFRENLTCCSCGLQGTKMFLEHSDTDLTPHFNLYAVEKHKLILMTKDHIKSKAQGGRNIHSNFQTMCAICNNLKGSSHISLTDVYQLRLIAEANKDLPKKQQNLLLTQARRNLKLIQHPNVEKAGKYFASIDLRIWRKDGQLYARSVYDHPMRDAEEIASIPLGGDVDVDGPNIKILEEICQIPKGYIGTNC
jgi:HNH endonuclease